MIRKSMRKTKKYNRKNSRKTKNLKKGGGNNTPITEVKDLNISNKYIFDFDRYNAEQFLKNKMMRGKTQDNILIFRHTPNDTYKNKVKISRISSDGVIGHSILYKNNNQITLSIESGSISYTSINELIINKFPNYDVLKKI